MRTRHYAVLRLGHCNLPRTGCVYLAVVSLYQILPEAHAGCALAVFTDLPSPNTDTRVTRQEIRVDYREAKCSVRSYGSAEHVSVAVQLTSGIDGTYT